MVQKVLHGGSVGGQAYVLGGLWRIKCTAMVQILHRHGAKSAARRCNWRATEHAQGAVEDQVHRDGAKNAPPWCKKCCTAVQ